MGSGVTGKGGVRVRGRHTFADSLHGADLAAIFHLVNGEVYLGQRLLLLYRANGIVDLDIASVLRAWRTGAVCVHVGLGGEGYRG